MYHAVATSDREVTFDGWSARASNDIHRTTYKQTGAVHKSFASQTPVALDDIIDEEIAYLKVDVESHEPSVFRSARRLIEKQLIKYVLFEWTYFIGGKYHFSSYAEDVVGPLLAARYRCFVATPIQAIRMGSHTGEPAGSHEAVARALFRAGGAALVHEQCHLHAQRPAGTHGSASCLGAVAVSSQP